MKRCFRILPAACLLGMLGAAPARALPSIHWNEDPAHPVFELCGWQELSEVHGPEPSNWTSFFSVFVDQADGSAVPPLTGSYRLEDGVLLFEPRYSLQAGLRYRAVFRPRGETTPPAGVVTKIFSVPKSDSAPSTFVEHVYPSANRLPENQLKFYIHFSGPMSRGEAYRRVSLLDEEGRRIPLPFLEIDQELWDREGRRLTLLFDPGRVKRDLLPNREEGSPLREGRSYALVIDHQWPDGTGRPLKQVFRKSFEVGPPDHEPPNEQEWSIAAPGAGGRDPLSIGLTEPMDHALLLRVIDVITPTGERIAGTVEVDLEETRWMFRPDERWKAGDYVLEVATFLEDLAGNSLGRPFEVDVFEKVEEKVSQATQRIRFTVTAK